ncbi:MAG: hypothetical protein U0W40_20530 [Acidimicrobiia bacterium]
MTAILRPNASSDPRDESVLARARDLGFDLVTYESSSGQLIYEWRRGDEPRPQFVTRRVALLWMDEFLAGSRLRAS